jgi:hypothetical protein
MAVPGVKTRVGGIFDAEMEFKDAGLVAASAAATVDDAAQVVDVGLGLFKGCMILDVSALEIADNDEIYDIVVQGSPDSTFTAATIADLASLNLSAKEVKRTDCNKDDGTGRYKIYFDNENDGTYYQYVRLYTVVAGTIATGINYSAFCVPMV